MGIQSLLVLRAQLQRAQIQTPLALKRYYNILLVAPRHNLCAAALEYTDNEKQMMWSINACFLHALIAHLSWGSILFAFIILLVQIKKVCHADQFTLSSSRKMFLRDRHQSKAYVHPLIADFCLAQGHEKNYLLSWRPKTTCTRINC